MPDGLTLTISPGVVIKGQAASSHLLVNGTLIADGTTADTQRALVSRRVDAPRESGDHRDAQRAETGGEASCLRTAVRTRTARANDRDTAHSAHLQNSTVRGGAVRSRFAVL